MAKKYLLCIYAVLAADEIVTNKINKVPALKEVLL